MPTVDFGACLSTYWFVWSINGLGSIFGLAINMVVSFFFLKYFHNIVNKPKTPKKPKSQFSNYRTTTPVTNIAPGPWTNDPMMGNTFNTSGV